MLRQLLSKGGSCVKQAAARPLASYCSPMQRAPGASWNQDAKNSNSKSFDGWYGLMWFSAALAAGVSVADCSSEKKTQWPVISRKSVEKHNTMEKKVWVTYGDGVYDVTQFIANHPGGKEKLMSVAGKDIAQMWSIYAHHKTSPLALELLEEMKIGVLPPEDVIVPPKSTHVAKYSNKQVYDVVIVGSGLSGLQCGWSLVNQYKVDPKKILILEAQDYVGGRVKQITEFMKGAKIEVGAEFLHGNGTELTKFAKAAGEPLREIFCWAHGDGGPLDKAVDKGYGLYYIGASDLNAPNAYRLPRPYKDGSKDLALNSKPRLLRYDAQDPDFVALNEALWELAELHEDDYDDNLSLYDFLLAKKLNMNMLKMGEAGFANTLCSNSHELSLKQAIKWSRIWHNEGEEGVEDGDYTFKNSYSSLVDHLKKNLQIELCTPVHHISTPSSASGTSSPATGSEDGLVHLTTKEGVEYRAKNVVLTASPHVINNGLITFSPPLPDDIQDAFSWVKMNSVTKVILKFKRPAWPRDLHGMIMVDDNFLLPEVWFRNVEDEVSPDEPATAYAVGFTTANYAARLDSLSQEEVLKRCVQQLEQVFIKLQPEHMSEDAHAASNAAELASLPKASAEFLGGMFWDWRPSHHPYIGGGYCSPLAGKPIAIGEVLKKGNGEHMFFAGEATNDRPGATAHAALETGLRAAAQVAHALEKK